MMKLALLRDATLGEGILWNAQTQQWWWTDIEGSAVFSWSPTSGDEVTTFKFPERVGSMAHTRSGRLLVAMAKRVSVADIVDVAAGAVHQPTLELAAPVDALESRTRSNDGRTDRRGYFVFGTMNEAAEKRPIGSFYQYSVQHGLRRLALPAVAISNSICFSLDGKTIYFSDTLTHKIMQADYDAESAQVSNIRLFVEVDVADAWPDGSVIDSEGCLWNAQWGGYRVVRYSPAGEILQIVETPVKNPSCPAIGGENMDELFVTTARQDMTDEELQAQPQAGSLFSFKLDKALGLSDALFDDQTS
jgi:L-arabinonolactonase